MKAVDRFFLAAFSVLFVASLTYAIISWVMVGGTGLTLWIAPVITGVLLMMELHKYRTKRD